MEADALVGASRDEVWQLYDDIAGTPRWVPSVREILYVSGPARVGTIYRERNRLSTTQWEIVEHRRPTRQVHLAAEGRLERVRILTFEARGSGDVGPPGPRAAIAACGARSGGGTSWWARSRRRPGSRRRSRRRSAPSRATLAARAERAGAVTPASAIRRRTSGTDRRVDRVPGSAAAQHPAGRSTRRPRWSVCWRSVRCPHRSRAAGAVDRPNVMVRHGPLPPTAWSGRQRASGRAGAPEAGPETVDQRSRRRVGGGIGAGRPQEASVGDGAGGARGDAARGIGHEASPGQACGGELPRGRGVRVPSLASRPPVPHPPDGPKVTGTLLLLASKAGPTMGA